MAENNNSKTAIIVSLITVIGTIIVALINKADITSKLDSKTTVNDSTKAITQYPKIDNNNKENNYNPKVNKGKNIAKKEVDESNPAATKNKFIPAEQTQLLLEESGKDNPNIQLIKQYINNGADVNAKDKWNNTPLYNIIWVSILHKLPCSLDVLKLLIENGANINAHNNNLSTALGWAVGNRRYEIVKFLIDNNANVNIISFDKTPLDNAVNNTFFSVDLTIVSLLISHGAKKYNDLNN